MDRLVGQDNNPRLLAAIEHTYRQGVAASVHFKYRSALPVMDDVSSEFFTPPFSGNFTDPTRLRLQQSPISTRLFGRRACGSWPSAPCFPLFLSPS